MLSIKTVLVLSSKEKERQDTHGGNIVEKKLNKIVGVLQPFI